MTTFIPISEQQITNILSDDEQLRKTETCLECGDNFLRQSGKLFCSDRCKYTFGSKHQEGLLKELREKNKTLKEVVKRKPGDRYLSADGYVMVKTSGKSIPEHRLIMEIKLGRKLKPGESVHHKDGVRHNNTEENLELWIGGVRYGQRAHELVCPHCGKSYAIT